MEEVKLFNSLTNKVEVFKPLKEGEITCYVCGPTVYNYVHIGNMRPVVVFDILRRLFLELGYKVTFISNFTDIDDKVIYVKNDKFKEGKYTFNDINTYHVVKYKISVYSNTSCDRYLIKNITYTKPMYNSNYNYDKKI